MNVLLIVCDTLRADHLGCYGYFRETSPNIDRIAEEGVLFEDFHNAGCPTGPGFTSIITGLHAIHHRFYKFGTPNIRQVDDTIFTMAEILRTAGYRTAAFDNLIAQGARAKHFVRGYEFYVNCGPYAFLSPCQLKAEQLNHRLVPWLKEYSNEKFFLFVHYWDPHGPYNQPEKYRSLFRHRDDLSDLEVQEAPAGYIFVPGWGRVEEISKDEQPTYYGQRFPSLATLVDLYDGEIAYMDNAIGKVMEILETKDVIEKTLVIVTSDHGEHLCQHENYGWQHDGLHDAVTHIPLVMRYPEKFSKGIRVRGFCQQTDILPTLLDLLGIQESIMEIDGKSVLPLQKGENIRSHVFMEHSSGQRSIRTDEWHLLDSQLSNEWLSAIRFELPKGLELYNVREDPMEIVDLVESEEEKAEELKDVLQRWIRSNLRDGETDPALYGDLTELQKKGREYYQKVRLLQEELRHT